MKKVSYLLLACVMLFSLVNVSALSLGVHIPEKYTDVVAGERFYFEVEVVYPENPSRRDLRLEYEILTKEGELISQSKVVKAIETQASFIDFIVIPKSAENGFHTININVKDYEDLSEEAGASFYVVPEGEQIKMYFFILMGAIVLIGVLIAINIILTGRRK